MNGNISDSLDSVEIVDLAEIKYKVNMKVDTILSSSVLTKIHKELGEGGLRLAPGDEETRSLVQHREDHVWIWNTKGRIDIGSEDH